MRNRKLLGTSASLPVTSALLVVTRTLRAPGIDTSKDSNAHELHMLRLMNRPLEPVARARKKVHLGYTWFGVYERAVQGCVIPSYLHKLTKKQLNWICPAALAAAGFPQLAPSATCLATAGFRTERGGEERETVGELKAKSRERTNVHC